MNVRDLRIGDIVEIKTLKYEDSYSNRVQSIDSSDVLSVKINDFKSIECDILDLNGVKATSVLLSKLGAWYDDKKVEHIFTFKGGLRIAIRPQIGNENYIATRIGEYRPKYCKFTYIHELQHWLWDMYKVIV